MRSTERISSLRSWNKFKTKSALCDSLQGKNSIAGTKNFSKTFPHRKKLFVIATYFRDLLLPFNSHEWPRLNFSLQYQYNINQMSDENKEKCQFGDN